jgi:hypothetical protein
MRRPMQRRGAVGLRPVDVRALFDERRDQRATALLDRVGKTLVGSSGVNARSGENRQQRGYRFQVSHGCDSFGLTGAYHQSHSMNPAM